MGVIVLNVGFCSSASADFPGLCPPALGSAPGRVARARGGARLPGWAGVFGALPDSSGAPPPAPSSRAPR